MSDPIMSSDEARFLLRLPVVFIATVLLAIGLVYLLASPDINVQLAYLAVL